MLICSSFVLFQDYLYKKCENTGHHAEEVILNLLTRQCEHQRLHDHTLDISFKRQILSTATKKSNVDKNNIGTSRRTSNVDSLTILFFP